MAKTKTPERNQRAGQKSSKPVLIQTTTPAVVTPLFRRLDWLALLITFGVVWVVYFLTLAPELTLRDSGELVTGSMYAGIPHPPGYPVWTIYSWLWTVLVPWGNPAWRVALAEAFLGSLACGLLSLMVSRGSSLFIESIEEFKGMTGKWESAICMVSGCVAGLLLGLDGFMWRESVAVNRIAVSSVPWFLVVLLCLLRWFYAPHQYRYLYWALFVFGICFTTHQSLIVAGIGVQVAIAAANPKLGRDVFFFDFLLYLLYYLMPLTGHHVFANIEEKPGLFFLFNVIGIGALLASIWLALRTKGLLSEWLPVVILGGLWLLGASFYFYMAVSGMTNPPMQWGYPRTIDGFWHALSRGQYEQPNPTNLVTESGRFVSQLGMLISGVADEFTWVYMFLALIPFLFYFKMQKRERAWIIGLSAMYFCLGVLLLILLNPTPDRASAELIQVFFCNSHTIVAALIGYGLALTATFMATHYTGFRLWGLIGGVIAAILGVLCLWTETGRLFFGPAGAINLSELPHYMALALEKNRVGLPVLGNLVLVLVPVIFVCSLLIYRQRGPVFITLALFLAMPIYSALAHYFHSDQHNHMFGYWYGHDMFTPPFKGSDGKPIYPEMAKDAVLYGGTDPGRFCPTYMVFCESFTPHNCQPKEDQAFDRRDVYVITQNALADPPYLNYIRAHYNRSKEIDPPFFQELFRSDKEREQGYQTNLLARLVSPLDDVFESNGDRVEKRRRTYTSWFTGKDFLDLPGLAAKLRPGPTQDPVSKFIYDSLTSETKQLLQPGANQEQLRVLLAPDLNTLLDRELATRQRITALQQQKAGIDQKVADGSTSEKLRRQQDELAKEIGELSKVSPLYDPQRFRQVEIPEYLRDFITENPQSHTRVRLNRLLLEAAYPKEIARSIGGVYPDREMYIATPEDSQRCFNDYLADSQRRLQHDTRFPNEPKQIRPGEEVQLVGNRMSVSGQIAVMAINALIAKVIFDHNPKNEFYVEESLPLEWMFPYLTPYGIIMKVNRQPLASLSEDILQRDHEFWKQYSTRLTGDVVSYDTSVRQVCDWIEKTFLKHDFNGFTGDRKFMHDEDAQKAFSKLRCSIGGIYAWRLSNQAPIQYRPKSQPEQQRLLKEAEFAFRQSFAYCPFNTEVLMRYVNLLLPFNRVDDALLLAETCLKLDPYNTSVAGMVANLKSIKAQISTTRSLPPANTLPALEAQVSENPTNVQAAVQLAGIYAQNQQTGEAVQLLNSVISNPAATANAVIGAAQIFMRMGQWANLEKALETLTRLSPESPEAWYDLAACKAALGKNSEAIPSLALAVNLSANRLQRDPAARDLSKEARQDSRFNALRNDPAFQKIVPPQ